MSPRTRKLAGSGLLLIGLIAWIVLVLWAVEFLRPLSPFTEIAIYLVAGVVWALPLKPFMQWMHRP